MKEELLTYVQYILNSNKITQGYDVNALIAHTQFLKEREEYIEKQEAVISRFDPIFSHHQKPFNR